MGNISTYLKQYGQYSFSEKEFNEVDNIIFSTLSYIDLADIVPPIGKGSITIEDASKLFYKKYTKNDIDKNVISVRKASHYLREVAESVRFKDLLLYNYEYSVTFDMQFGALCIRLPNNSVYVSYEGTDGYISGWEEDFMLAYMFPTNSQRAAVRYLNRVVGLFSKKVYVGGHSKGGNLALVSSMYANSIVRHKIKKVFCNDGPGLRENEYNSKAYKKVSSKLVTLVPNESFVGMLLRHNDQHTVIKSTGKRFFQHDVFRWQVEDDHFVRTTLSDFSRKINRSVITWLDKLDDKRREKLVKAIFSTLKKAEINDLTEFKASKLNSIYKVLKETKNIDKETKAMMMDSLKDLMSEISKGVVKDGE